MKTFTLPVSDCGCFHAGELAGDIVPVPANGETPQFGVVIWYRDKELAETAFIAARDAMFTSE
jgi:hypothetical protein